MENPENFEGSVSFILGFPSHLKTINNFSTIRHIPVNGGIINFEIKQNLSIEVTFQPKSSPPYTLQTASLDFYTDVYEFVAIITWKNDFAQIWINRTVAASTEKDFAAPSIIPIRTTTNNHNVDTTQFEDDSIKKQLQRNIDAQNLNRLNIKHNERRRTLEERIETLQIEIDLLKDLIQQIINGKFFYWLPLATSMRKLVCRIESKQHYPLLQRISGLLNYPLMIYTNPNEDIPPFEENLQYCYNVHLATQPNSSCPVKVDFDRWLELKHICVRTNDGLRKYTNNDLLSHIANKLACHYDDTVIDFAEILEKSLTIEGKYSRSLYTQNLIQTAEVIIEMSEKIISFYKKTNN